MKKFKFLVLFGLKKRIFKKAFVITNLLLGLGIIAVINIPSIIGAFSSDEVETQKVMIENNTDDASYPLETTLIEMMNTSSGEERFEAYDGTFDDFWESDVDIYMIFTDALGEPDVDLYLKDQGDQNLVMSSVQAFLNDYQGIQYASFNVIDPPPSDDPAPIDEETRMFIDGIVTILALPIFFLVMLATQFLGVDIIEEKSSKIIETIIASVPATIHFLAKIVSNLGFLILQALILLGFSIVGMGLGSLLESSVDFGALSLIGEITSRVPNFATIVILMVLFTIFGALIFLALAALIASIATTQEDYQQFQAPLIFLLLGGFYIAIFLPMMGADNFVHIAAYIPFLSTLVAPVAYATGVIGLLEALLILLFHIVITLLFLYAITPVYRVAILSYEETKFFRRIKFYFKKAFAKKKAK